VGGRGAVDGPIGTGDAELRGLAAALGDRADKLAASGRASEIPALWETAISTLDDDASRAGLTLSYAWYQALHGQIPAGVTLAARLLNTAWAAGPIRVRTRILIRTRWRVAPAAVAGAWNSATESPLPDWVRLTDGEIQVVVDWVSAASWEQSRAFYGKHAAALRSASTSTVLDELALGGQGALIGLHRAILVLCAGPWGADGGYGCLDRAAAAQAAATSTIARRAWDELRACGTVEALVHRRAFLGSVHVVIADAAGNARPTVSPQLFGKLRELAEAAPADERYRAAADLRTVSPGLPGRDAIRALLDLGSDSRHGVTG
jgi:hypothetical protein